VPDAVTKGLLDAPEDQLERMTSQAAHLGSATLSRFADIVHNGLTEMRGTTAPRLLLELICARMLLPGVDDSTGALLQRLERMERRLTAGGEVIAGPVTQAASPPTAVSSPAASAPSGAAPDGASLGDASPGDASSGGGGAAVPGPDVADHAAAPTESAPVAAPTESVPVAEAPRDSKSSAQPGALDAVAVRRVWDEVLAIVSRKSKRAAAVVREATVREVEGETLVLVFRHSVHADMLSKSPEILVEALYELLGGHWVLRCEVGSGPAGPAGGSRLQSPPARPPTDPPSPRAAPAEAAGSLTRAGRSATPMTSSAAPMTNEEWPTLAQPGGQAVGQAVGQAAHQPAGDWPAPAQPDGAGEQRAAKAGDWPTPVQPGGVAAQTRSATDGHDGGDWPAPAPLGAPATASEPVPDAGSKDAVATRSAGRGAGSSFATPAIDSAKPTGAPGSVATPSPRRSAAAEQARAAASRAGSTQRSGAGQRGSNQRGGAQRTGKGQRPGGPKGSSGSGSAWDGTAADEPPYDPEYDGPPADDPKAAGDPKNGAGEAKYPGFDPGDEPMDDADPGATRESTEEAALRLLSETLGAEKIGETGG
jgi:DNA polymerase-3 subunit gamma/tau